MKYQVKHFITTEIPTPYDSSLFSRQGFILLLNLQK